MLSFATVPLRAAPLDLSKFTFITEENMPYNFTDEGELKGIAPELLALIADNLQQKFPKVHVWPWVRGYHQLQTDPGTVLFSTSWTNERDRLGFRWAGPITTARIVLMARKDANIELQSLQDARNYVIATILDDVGEQSLLEKGFGPPDIRRFKTSDQLVRLLANKRVDLVAKGESVMQQQIIGQGLDPNDFEVVFVLKERDAYFAFHKDTSDQDLAAFQQELDKIRDQHQTILIKYNQVPLKDKP